MFSKKYEYVEFLLWAALDDEETKVIQSVEMYNALINILLKNKEQLFIAKLRHDTSYLFYQILLKKDFVEEISHSICGYELNRLEEININLFSKNDHFDSLLDKGLVIKRSKIDHIYHEILFSLTDSFVEYYGNSRLLKK